MMRGVHLAPATADKFAQPAARFNLDLVNGVHRRVVVMAQRGLALRGDILNKRPAERDIQQFESPPQMHSTGLSVFSASRRRSAQLSYSASGISTSEGCGSCP